MTTSSKSRRAKRGFLLLLPAALCLGLAARPDAQAPPWGFYPHRLINELAVYTLPTELVRYFKPHIGYLREHATDPDVRRYRVEQEGIRHHIDLDALGDPPFSNLPRSWPAALRRFSTLHLVFSSQDTLHLPLDTLLKDSLLPPPSLRRFFQEKVLPGLQNPPAVLRFQGDSLRAWFADSLGTAPALLRGVKECRVTESLSQHGILPWHLERMLGRLTAAFREGKAARILDVAAELGHYLADAHVPLHTTANYDGQFTDQRGIHAFWETRIPELFAESDFDLWTGKARYLERPREFFWQVVMDSHARVDSVLRLEKQLRDSFPPDRILCFGIRGTRTLPLECPEYAAAYHRLLNRMVERRMRAAIHAVGSAWYTAWIDAGKPHLPQLLENTDK